MARKKTQPLPGGSEWSFESIEAYDEAIGRIAEDYGLDCYPHLLEIISTEQMMDAYASIGMPVYYHHWSFGKQFLATESRYKRGQMGLAYEIVINSDPCIAYLMEENTLPMQALVIAHAAYGHNSFFKGNHLFRQWTSANAIIDYLLFARNYIAECEERHGQDAVERLLDSCHALMNLGVDRYKRRPQAVPGQGAGAAAGAGGVPPGPGERAVADPAPPAGQGRAGGGEAVPQGARGEHPLFHREERPPPGTLAAGGGAHRPQDRPVLPPPAPDPGDERGVGHLLALHPAQHPLRPGPGERRLHPGVPPVPHQRRLPAPLQQQVATPASTRTPWASTCGGT